MARQTLFESEGWRPIDRLRCACPHCGEELQSNAFARFKHKEKCDHWKNPEFLVKKNVAPVPERRASSDSVAKQSPAVRPARAEAVPPANDAARNPAAPPLPPKLRWTECRVAGTEEFSAWAPGSPLTSLRVRRVGMRAAPSYTSYAGSRYVGSFRTAEAAMGAAENFGHG